ncbi:nuclear transport factor 2 family protein [Luteibacter sp. PPL201]|jgi:hypothetical protein|uniref:Nuclear transport factor 2 family protein n=1 Tax=Luteibacter sahnii TaxID=3021977 RepID=A0ABT6BAE3_9GAMM|nr:nuclear transport factor 2 family protein [Luteibacter sp. PPL193]MDY1547057.1 nuclear transport factor 2 family protein [Luteibacter sp. PPL193]
MRRRATALSLALLALSTGAMAGEASPEAAVTRYVKAEGAFDLAALKAVLAPGFVEISPRGEVDEHDAVLSFYAPEKKTPAPPLSVIDLKARTQGDAAVVTATLVLTLAPGQERRMTLGATAVRAADGWQLRSAQYTPVPPRPAPAH